VAIIKSKLKNQSFGNLRIDTERSRSIKMKNDSVKFAPEAHPLLAAKNKKNKTRGFTLVEILVSVAIFSVAMGIVVQMFYYSLRMQKYLTAHFQLFNEISYNMEYISRGLRMAQKSIDSSCLTSAGLNFEKTAAGIKFRVPNATGGSDCVEYYTATPPGYPAAVIALMEKRTSITDSYDLPLTSPKITILNFEIKDSGWMQTDNLQPRVTIYIKAQGAVGEILENQFTVSQRNLDISQ
jgi:prepilin-type N-terminal cleavage/methylation domain-containing protein